MKILVLGRNGQLGRCLQDQFKKTNYQVIFASRNDIDLSDNKLLATKILSINPDILINAAAYTDVDNAEKNAEEANLINNLAVATIANICNDLGSWLIHISTDYVFDGTSNTPYHESDQTNPKGIYGESKLSGEISIKSSGANYLIIRTAWVFSEYGNNFLKTMLKLGSNNHELSIVGDQVGCPTYAQDIAKAIISILPYIKSNKCTSNTFNFCGDCACSWYEFAEAIFTESSRVGLKTPNIINSIVTKDYPTLAVRPAYSVLDCSKIKNSFNIEPSNWRNNIKNVIKKLNYSNDNI